MRTDIHLVISQRCFKWICPGVIHETTCNSNCSCTCIVWLSSLYRCSTTYGCFSCVDNCKFYSATLDHETLCRFCFQSFCLISLFYYLFSVLNMKIMVILKNIYSIVFRSIYRLMAVLLPASPPHSPCLGGGIFVI